MILMIDNYDSFTYNLVQYFFELDQNVRVFRNNKISVGTIKKLNPDSIVISPGPCTPLEAGISNDVIHAFSGKKPILGVCLGHQCLGYVFGGKIIRAKRIMHGKTSNIYHDRKNLFRGVERPFTATRYHSLVVDPTKVPGDLEVTAWTQDKEIMGLRHRKHPTFGVQFHPESILTAPGKQILRNFIEIASKY